MSDEVEVTVDKKDITYDILIDGTEPDLSGESETEEKGPKEDHPVVVAIDLAVKHSEGYLKKQGLPPANTDIYQDFGRPYLNDAAWHYLPDGGSLDDPRIALVIGVAGLGLAFAPTLMALNERREQEKKQEEQEKKRRREEKSRENEGEEKPEEKRTDIPGPVAEPPDWMARLEAGGRLGGM